MASIDELLDKAYGASSESPSSATGLDESLAANKAQFAGPTESLSEAAAADVKWLSSVDPTQPSNLTNILHHGIPIVLQALIAGRAGPGAAQGLGRVMQAGRSGLGALLGYGYQEGIEPAMKGEETNLSPGMAALNFILGAGADAAIQGGGAAMRRVSGKAGMLAEGEAAAATAEAKAVKAQEAAQQKVLTRAEALEQVKLKHSDTALADTRQDVLEKDVRRLIGAPSPLESPTIETLSERVAPIRESAERNVRSIFKGLSQKFEDKLLPHYETPVVGDFAAAVDAQRSILEASKDTVSRKMSGLMDEVAELGTAGGFNVSALPPNLRAEYQRMASQMPREQAERTIKAIAQGDQRGLNIGEASGTTVKRVDEVRRKLTAVLIGSSPAIDKRVAGRLINSIDESLEPVLPEQMRADWANLRRDWREANSVFSSKFRSTLFRADTPAAVADTLYGAAKGDKAHRVLALINATPADEVPLLRSAFAERLTRGDVVRNVEGMDPRVFKALFKDTGFDNPKEWIDTLGTNIVQKVGLNEVAGDPALFAKFQARLQEGLGSFGVKTKERALARAEALLKKTPDPASVVRGAMEAGEMEGMKAPILGRRIHNYIENRHAWEISMGLAALGSYGGPLSHPAELLPFLYLGIGKAANAALSNPRVGKMWHTLLKSQNAEQFAFWSGRLAAASLTETARSPILPRRDDESE